MHASLPIPVVPWFTVSIRSLAAALLLLCLLPAPIYASSPIYVHKKATGGSGTEISPWTGWDTGITWAPHVTYHFKPGWYAYNQSPALWSQANMILLGQPGTVLKYTGPVTTGAAVAFDGGTAPATLGGIIFENFIIDGGGNAADGLYVATVGRSRFTNIRIRNVTTNGFNLVFNVLNIFTNPRVAEHGTSYAMPSTLMRMDARSDDANKFSSANTIINPIFEHVPNATGLLMRGQSSQNTVIGGTIESVGTGISICPDNTYCSRNTFTGVDIEANTVADIIIAGSESNQFNNVLCTSENLANNGVNLDLLSNSSNNQFIGGKYSKIREQGLNNSFINIGTRWANVSSWRRNTAFINIRDLGDSSSRTLLPANTSIGPSGQLFKNSFVTTASLSFSSIAKGGSAEVSTPVHTSMLVGDVVSVAYNGDLPAGLVLSGYVDSINPQNVKVRWQNISDAPQTPPSGTYKIVVFQ